MPKSLITSESALALYFIIDRIKGSSSSFTKLKTLFYRQTICFERFSQAAKTLYCTFSFKFPNYIKVK